MSKKMKILIAMIAIISVLIMIIIIILNLIKKDNGGTFIKADEQQLGDEGVKIRVDRRILNNSTLFYTVEDCINNYINNIKNKNSVAVYNILDEDYIKNNNITIDNVLSIAKNINLNFIGTTMYQYINENMEYYIVQGVTDDYSNTMFFEVVFDTSNITYSLIPVSNKNNIEEINIIEHNNNIESNEFNTIKYNRIKDAEIIKKYFKYYNELSKAHPEQAYNLLDDNYKNLRFKTIENYIEYLQETSKNEYTIFNYKKVNEENDTKYIFSDNYNNVYTITETATMNFKIQLDNYTILDSNIIEQYNNLPREKKVVTNIDKFIKMITNANFEASYDLLDNTFKANNFPSIDIYKDYIKQNWYNSGIYEIKSVDTEGEYYVAKITIKDKEAVSALSKDKTIIIKLLEGMNFVMSFGIE